MQLPLQITFRDVEASDAIEARIKENTDRLERFYDRITGCRVVVASSTRRGHKGRLYQIGIDLTVPGGEIVVNRDPGQNRAHEDVYVAIRDAFRAAKRQLEDHVRRQSGHRTKAHPAPHYGQVARIFDAEGYGFIATPDRGDIYFHRNAVVEGGWEKLDVGVPVRFTEAMGEEGPHALNVAPHEKGPGAD